MDKLYDFTIRQRKWILAVFVLAFVVCFCCKPLVGVNYDINSYLPSDTVSSIALNTMQEEFSGGIPNAKVMINNVSVPEALEYKKQLMEIEGVEAVTWLDDSVDLEVPLEMQDKDTVEQYYKDEKALFSLTIASESTISAVEEIRNLIGDENAMTGSAVSKALATVNTQPEVKKISIIAVIFAIVVLIFTTTSWVEPIIVMVGLGVAIMINAGSNLLFGEISFVTNASGSILQLAVSLDYSVFLIHRFGECRKTESNIENAMKKALIKSTSAILSSALTTIIGFIALAVMKFRIGPDLGLALAKGVTISLVTVLFFMPGLILLTYKWMDKTEHKSFIPDLGGFGRFVQKIMVPMAIMFTVIIVPSYLASTASEYHYGSSQIYGEGTQYGDDTKQIKESFGRGDTYVLLVEKGDTAVETALSEELKQIKQVKSIVSFVTLAGAQVPYEYLDEETLSLLESDKYSRMVITVDADAEGDETIELIETIREIAHKYYPETYHLAGEGISTYDLREVVTEDLLKVNFLAIGAVFLVLLISMKSVILPIILVLTIETAIWINLSFPYFADDPLFYIAYLIITSIQLGATVDYAILLTERYKEIRIEKNKKESVIETIAIVTPSILTSGTVMTVVGFLLGKISSHGIISQLGNLMGRGSLCSMAAVLFVLPGYLYVFDKWFMKKKEQEEKAHEL